EVPAALGRIHGGSLPVGIVVSPRLRSAAGWLPVARCPDAADDGARAPAAAECSRLADPGDLHYRPWHRFARHRGDQGGRFRFYREAVARGDAARLRRAIAASE